jgi:hypothetical protein
MHGEDAQQGEGGEVQGLDPPLDDDSRIGALTAVKGIERGLDRPDMAADQPPIEGVHDHWGGETEQHEQEDLVEGQFEAKKEQKEGLHRRHQRG